MTNDTKWVSFAGNQPGLVPAGTEDSTADLNVYENVMAMIETEGKAQAISVGAIVRVKDTWRLIDVPQVNDSTADHHIAWMLRVGAAWWNCFASLAADPEANNTVPAAR